MHGRAFSLCVLRRLLGFGQNKVYYITHDLHTVHRQHFCLVVVVVFDSFVEDLGTVVEQLACLTIVRKFGLFSSAWLWIENFDPWCASWRGLEVIVRVLIRFWLADRHQDPLDFV